MENQVINEFFAKWHNEFMEYFKGLKKEKNEIGYTAFMDKYRGKLAKQTFIIIQCRTEKGVGYTSIEDIVEKDMENKKKTLLYKIKGKVGEITLVNLTCGEDGTPNGYIEGTEGKARIETITAGGYNIQCLHYRVLVKSWK